MWQLLRLIKVFSLRGTSAHTLQIGVSIGVLGRRVPGPIVLLSVLDGRVMMAVRQLSVHFADDVVIQFQIALIIDDIDASSSVIMSMSMSQRSTSTRYQLPVVMILSTMYRWLIPNFILYTYLKHVDIYFARSLFWGPC
jgi:hypothetical protein